MSANPSILSLPVSYDHYVRHGWSLVPIPPGVKGPNTKGWNLKQNALKDHHAIPPGYGVGLAHAYSGTCAIDIDNWDEAVTVLAESGIDLNALYNANDAVTIDSGNPGHGKLIYAMPFGVTLPSKKIVNPVSGKVVYELRCASANGLTLQDVLPPSRHPSGTTYQWGGRGKWEALPTLPIALLDLWQKLVSADKDRVVSNGTIDASWDEIRSAVFTINPDCSRDDWRNVGMALHYAGHNSGQEAQAFFLWDEWSMGSETKYPGRDALGAQWKSFQSNHPDGIKLGSLFHLASQAGWKRPVPDVTQLFKNVRPQTPADVIDSLRHPSPDIDMSLFPPVLRRRAEEVAQSVGCDVLVPLWAGMAAICGAADARTRLEIMDGFKVPPLLWVMTIGDPAEKKTPGSTPMLSVLGEIEREGMPDYKRAHLAWEALDTAYKSSKKSYTDAAGHADFILSGMDVSSLPPVAPEPPAPPVPPRLVVKDITSQKLTRIVADRPAGVLCHLDEMASWVNKITDKNSGEDRSSWTIGYESNPHVVDRVGDQNSIVIENMAVAIYGNIQPKVYRNAMARLGDDGLLQRFIPVPLRQRSRPINEPIPDMLSNKAEWENLIRTIAKLPISTYRPDSQAYALYRDFQVWYEQNKQDERILQADNLYLQAYGKLEGLVGRVALVMHLASDPMNPILGHGTMQRAIDLIRGYVIPSYRYTLSEISGSIEQTLDVWILRHVTQLDASEITLSDIRRSAKRQLEGIPQSMQAEAIRYSMALLERSGWVVLVEDTAKRATWAINPDIGKAHPEYRLEVIKARQRQLDDARTIAMRASGQDIPRKLTHGYDPETMDNQ